MRSGDRSSGGVSEQGRRIDQTHKRDAADGPCVASMTSLNLLERMNELSDGVIRPFNATGEGRCRSISEIPVYSDCHDSPGLGTWPHSTVFHEVITIFVPQ